jgi:8-oxo-dGTP pyrophosphatase MutT (NUDIX family)
MFSRLSQVLNDYNPSTICCTDDIRAGVVIPVMFKDDDWVVLLTRRTQKVKSHPGEISFPGGMYEENDNDLMQTALRECCEEIGVRMKDIRVAGRLDDERTMTGFVMTPYVGVIPYPYTFRLSEDEVAYLIYLPFRFLAAATPSMEEAQHKGWVNVVPALYYEGERIWGATCRILLKFRRIIENGKIQP